jgi:hypothetical protein
VIALNYTMIFAFYKLVCFLQPVTDILEATPCILLLRDSLAGMHSLHQIDVVANQNLQLNDKRIRTMFILAVGEKVSV